MDYQTSAVMLFAASLVAAAACGPKSTDVAVVTGGEYSQFDVAVDGNFEPPEASAFEGATLVIDPDVARATVTLADGSTVELGLQKASEKQWSSGCHTMNSHVDQVAYLVTPSSFTLGPLEFDKAVLIADDCVDGPARTVVLTQLIDDYSSGCDRKVCISFERDE